MSPVYMEDPVAGNCALFEEAPGGGEAGDRNAPRNRPLVSPQDWLDHVYFHSAFDYLEVVSITDVTINHAAVATGSPPAGQTIMAGWNVAAANHLLVNHDLGYEPFALAIGADDNSIWPGMPVQTDAYGGGRYVTLYSTATQVRLYEWASIGANALAAISLTYKVYVFKRPPAPTGNVLREFDPVTGIVTMGRGKFDSSRRYLQVVAGGSPFAIVQGRTIDLVNGAPRALRTDGTAHNPIPSTLRLGLSRANPVQNYGFSYGSPMNYTGSFAGLATILVQAP